MSERRRVLLCGTWPDPHILDLLQPIVQCHPDTTRSDWPEYYCHLAYQYCSSEGLVQARLSSRPLGTMFLALGGDHVYFIAISMLTQTEQKFVHLCRCKVVRMLWSLMFKVAALFALTCCRPSRQPHFTCYLFAVAAASHVAAGSSHHIHVVSRVLLSEPISTQPLAALHSKLEEYC